MAEGYPFAEIETKWQKYWDENRLFEVTETSDKPPFYLLEMFPYPSGRIHMGHVRNYSIGDVMARYRMMQGYNVLHPMGWDAFGLPAENAAIQNQVHPAAWTWNNINDMRGQLKRMGNSYDWTREIATCDPEYYRWEQWLFLKFYERGLAYRKEAVVNWCDSCQTVLANEEVDGGNCWRCENAIIQKPLAQWFFKITDYADKLLDDLQTLKGNWPDQVITMQHHWIGKSLGAEINFPLADASEIISVFTTRPDTTFGATYMVLAPEHPLVRQLIRGTQREAEVVKFIDQVSQIDKEARMAEEGEKNGCFIGAYCINPVTQERIPIWIADYVLAEYGTGAVMAVPAHDHRDFVFARKYDLPIRVVIQPSGEQLAGDTMTEAYVDPGIMADSGQFNGLASETGKVKVIEWMESKGVGKAAINYRIRDWCVSRQRYWGTPFPIIYCDQCGTVPVPESELPVVLPEDAEFTGSGTTTLQLHRPFYEVECPTCGGHAHRETDTMGTFVDSSWYFARFTDAHSKTHPFHPEKVNYWLPVKHYVGGVEHAVMHLLYARFFTKVMSDLDLLEANEPFTKYLAQGMVCMATYRCEEHGYLFPSQVNDDNTCEICGGKVVVGRIEKMSKSKRNIVDPDGIIERFGADTMRVFSLFAAPPEKELEWNDDAVEGCSRFLNRVWQVVQQHLPAIEGVSSQYDPSEVKGETKELRRMTHATIERVTRDIDERLHFNTAISAIMEMRNFLAQFNSDSNPVTSSVLRESIEAMILMLSPFAPHIAEELWEKVGNQPSVTSTSWVSFDPDALKRDEIMIVVQVNGKLRSRIQLPTDSSHAEVEAAALADEKIQRYTEGKTVRKVIVVPNRLANIVV